MDHDAFLSHNSKDKPQVVKLKERLRERRLRSWYDDEELRPGTRWSEHIAEAVRSARAVLVCLGEHGLGPWHKQEMELALLGDKPVIPVILPSAPDDAKLPDFLALRSVVDLRDSGFSDDALDRLEFGITGVKPGPRAAKRHNLPRQTWFFGRVKELEKLEAALEPEVRSWGALIDGPGGIGKTALAIHAAERAAGRFERVVFVSAKVRELRAEGERALKDFVTAEFSAMLRELGAELGEDLDRVNEAERVRVLNRVLAETSALIVFDNLESLSEDDRLRVYGFLERLPSGCKAIVTSRRRDDLGVRTLRLTKLEDDAALELIEALAEDRPLLRAVDSDGRRRLIEETGGNPLLLRWVAGQLGRGACTTLDAALELLARPTTENDPLEYVFGDLARGFTANEAKVVCALSHFKEAAELRHVAELAGVSRNVADGALETLAFRALVNADSESKRFRLAPLVAPYLRRARPEIVRETGERLTAKVYALVVENGYQRHEKFPELEREWGVIEAALPLFLAGENARLQTVCDALTDSFDFSGRWGAWYDLSVEAEAVAKRAGDLRNAGWRAYFAGWVQDRLGHGEISVECARRVATHWVNASARERAYARHLEGIGLRRLDDLDGALRVYREVLEVFRPAGGEDFATILNDIAAIERRQGDLDSAERDYLEALRIARSNNDGEGVATFTGNLADLDLDRRNYPEAERVARAALSLATSLSRKELIASNNHRIALARLGQSRPTEALPYAQAAVTLYAELRHPDLAEAKTTLARCIP